MLRPYTGARAPIYIGIVGLGAGFLRDDVHIHFGRLTQETMHCRKIKVLAPIADRGSPEYHLCDVLGPDEFCNRVGYTFALLPNHLRTKTLRKPQVSSK